MPVVFFFFIPSGLIAVPFILGLAFVIPPLLWFVDFCTFLYNNYYVVVLIVLAIILVAAMVVAKKYGFAYAMAFLFAYSHYLFFFFVQFKDALSYVKIEGIGGIVLTSLIHLPFILIWTAVDLYFIYIAHKIGIEDENDISSTALWLIGAIGWGVYLVISLIFNFIPKVLLSNLPHASDIVSILQTI